MLELRNRIDELFDRLNGYWTKSIKDGETKGIDLADMFSKYSQIQRELNQAFAEANVRMKKKRKWW